MLTEFSIETPLNPWLPLSFFLCGDVSRSLDALVLRNGKEIGNWKGIKGRFILGIVHLFVFQHRENISCFSYRMVNEFLSALLTPFLFFLSVCSEKE